MKRSEKTMVSQKGGALSAEAKGRLRPSRLTLGTVQFGLPYGVANRTGRPSFEAICELLEHASAGGVTTLDTAAAYGQSEEVLGRALRKTNLGERIEVVTKVEPLEQGLSPVQAGQRIEASVHRSLQHLGLEQLSACLFHREENLCYTDELLRLQERGLIAQTGVSVVSPQGAQAALCREGLSVLQIPSNVLDRRFTHSGITARASALGVTVFARSIYLQGLLLMSDAQTPERLRGICAARRQLRDLASAFDLPLAELLLRAMLYRSDIDALVIGVEAVGQLDVNLACFARGALPQAVLDALNALDLDVPQMLICPTQWPQ